MDDDDEKTPPSPGVVSFLKRNLNFYRIHLIFFTVTPLVCSAVLFAANGEFHISYVDALFNCVSAMTVTGLQTIDLSSLTAFQQSILFAQMLLGSPVTISWIMVYIRRSFFEYELQHLISHRQLPGHSSSVPQAGVPWHIRLMGRFHPNPRVRRARSSSPVSSSSRGKKSKKLNVDMIRRVVGDKPKLIDPMGWIAQNSDGDAKAERSAERHAAEISQPNHDRLGRAYPSAKSDLHLPSSSVRAETQAYPNRINGFPRSQTLQTTNTNPQSLQVGFAPTPSVQRPLSRSFTNTFSQDERVRAERTGTRNSISTDVAHGRRPRRPSGSSYAENSFSYPRQQFTEGLHHRMPRSATLQSQARSAASHIPHPSMVHPMRSINKDFGGFPGPPTWVSFIFKKFFPSAQRRLKRTMTIPLVTTYTNVAGPTRANNEPPNAEKSSDAKGVPYVTFEARVGRNSAFEMLTREELEELGGVEYRALNVLLWIVGIYHIGLQIIGFVVIAPYVSAQRWRNDFEPPALHRPVAPPWFALYQTTSAYTNTGSSLVDQSMVPFQTAYPMIFIMVFLVLAGNTAFPIFLRFFVWMITKGVSPKSRLNETLHFLLDHPRRCFIYLFPSHQTWFLLTVLLILNCTDWFFFLVLDIGNPEIETIPVGTRIALGLLQATAVRAAGFATVSLSALAPAVKVLYVTMMYVSVYPIAMSVRSTNVYEEKSFGVYETQGPEDSDEPNPDPHGSRTAIWGKYLAWHARKQLAFDMWWLGLALFLICIVERDQIQDTSNENWFNIFQVVFEIVSAYGTVGLSLGTPNANYSFSGAFRPLSKVIVCAIMLRGRHRGLPVAIDRAVLLPSDHGGTE
ncbi:TrkH-domain-containing protein [Sistotremastrum niveocremeum HHB9708]|uniref:Potassium transport protein n=1 Tax=Sistotremastrum niveocremeum HHB9708 TaxID=1314777 RepID=A0A164N2I5_9AGAM|nr:TrkH-domain-containing protein [Sistotremastrum niveocremeum HHB9708]